jgi:hypothetical protein
MSDQPIADQPDAEPIAELIAEPCAKCSQIHTKCSGHSNRSGGGPCGVSPIKGLTVCWSHGGASKRARAAAARRVQATAAEQAAKTYGVARDVNPVQAMVELLRDSAGHVAWLRDIVQATDADALIWGKSDEVDKGSGEFPGVDTKYAAAPSVWLAQYDKERRFLLDVSEKLARLGLDWDAREAIRREGAALAKVARAFVQRLGLDASDARVVGAWRGALRDALGAGQASGEVVDGEVL